MYQNFQKLLKKILKVKKDLDRARFTLSENIFNLNFCRVVFENLTQKWDQSTVWFENGDYLMEEH